MREISDEELATQFREGDECAYDQLYFRHWRTTIIQAYAVVHCAEDAEDVAQEVWIKYYVYPAAFDVGRGKFKPWIARCAVNKAIERQRSRSRHPTSPTDNVEAIADSRRHDIAEDVIEALDHTITRSVVLGCLKRLSLIHQQVLICEYYEELSIKEIAQYLGDLEGQEVRVGTVNSRLNRARNLLRECVEKHMGLNSLWRGSDGSS
jgi:RNA polymerase sigma factor (sigma-70 family)